MINSNIKNFLKNIKTHIMGSLFIREYDENVEKQILEALCETNPEKRIKMLEAIQVNENSRYKQKIDDCIIDAKLKPLW